AFLRHEDGPTPVGDDQVALPHLHPAHLDERAERPLHGPPAGGEGNNPLAIDWEADRLATIDIAAGPVDDYATNPSDLRGRGEDVAPTRNVGPPGIVDDDHVLWAACLNRRCRQVGPWSS